MLASLHAFLVSNPTLAKALMGGISGLGAAVVIDIRLFLKDGSWGQFLKDWSFSIASYRYLQGFIGGVVTELTGSGVASWLGI